MIFGIFHTVESHADPHALMIGQENLLGEKIHPLIEQNLQLLSSTEEEGLLIHMDGKIILSNQYFCNLLGYQREELLGKSLFDLAAPASIEYLNEKLRTKAEGKFQSLALGKDGSRIPVQTISKTVNFSNTSVRLIRVRKLEEAQRLGPRLQHLGSDFSHSLVGIALINKNGKTVQINEAMRSMLGYNKGELISSSLLKITHPDDLEKSKKLFRMFQKGSKEFLNTEVRLLRKNASFIWLKIIGSAVKNARGEFTCAIFMATDVNEQNRALVALYESEKKFKSIFEHSQIGISLVNQDCVPFLVNKALSDLLGYGQNEFKDISFPQITHPDDVKQDLFQFKRLLSGEIKEYSFEKRYIHKEGHIVWGRLTMTAVRDTIGGTQYAVAMISNVTEQKHAELALEKSEKMYRVLFEQATTAIYLTDLETLKLIDCNKKAVELFGYSCKQEFLSLKIYELSPSMQADGTTTSQKSYEVMKALENEGSCFIQWRHLKKDKTHFEGDISISLVMLGDKIYMQSMLRDITEQLEAEKRLKTAYQEVANLKKQLEQENLYLQNEIRLSNNFDDIIFGSQKFQETLRKVEQVAPVDATVLILGETGTGKELIARAIHKHSQRRHKPLVKLNCATLPRELIESELFGHEKGAFTGALKQKVGRFELAQNGTIFLDEIGELPKEIQPKLLRIIQEGEFERIGGTETLSLNVRIIAATNRDLKKEIECGNFREDLYYRLFVFPIEIPPLRERKEDIAPLVSFFILKYGKKFNKPVDMIPASSLKILEAYDWPGNVRELENIVERAVILAQHTYLPFEEILGSKSSPSRIKINSQHQVLSLKEIEKRHILKILEDSNWKINGPSGAAQKLELPPSTVRDRMKKYNITRPAS